MVTGGKKPTLEGKAARDLFDRLCQERLERRARALAEARAEAEWRGKEPFDLETLDRLCDTQYHGRLKQVEQRRQRYEYLYYVQNPELMTLAALAKLVDELNQWAD